jgi:hypothetical protein
MSLSHGLRCRCVRVEQGSEVFKTYEKISYLLVKYPGLSYPLTGLVFKTWQGDGTT